MGNCVSCGLRNNVVPWKEMVDPDEARDRYVSEKSLRDNATPEQVELRALLDDEVGMQHLIMFANANKSVSLLNFWGALKEFNHSAEGKDVKLKALYEKFAFIYKQTLLLEPPANFLRRQALLESLAPFGESSFTAKGNPSTLINGCMGSNSSHSASEFNREEKLTQAFNELRLICFDTLFTVIFQPFKASDEYAIMCAAIQDSYNQVAADDFEYLSKIGEGGFGLIVHCRKISTGRNYAAKIQPKAALLRHFRRTPHSVMVEMRAYACCSHPFLATLMYAFQTPSLAVMVMPLSACGDLSRSLRLSITGRMPLARVRFYAAEIVSALCYLHSNSLIYRDLKPGNILLNDDGHIMLADFGSLADMQNRLLDASEGPASEKNSVSNHESASQHSNGPLFAKSHGLKKPSEHSRMEGNSVQSGNNSLGLPSHFESEYAAVGGGNMSLNSNNASVDCGIPMDPDGPEEYHKDTGFKLKKRTGSLVGTIAYMAPEILVLFAKGDRSKDGYTDAVDWWSLGVTIYKLLVGHQPFTRVSYDELQFIFPGVLKRHDSYEDAFRAVFGKVDYEPEGVELDPDAIDIMKKLLTFDASKRLGLARDGDFEHEELKSHPFFAGIDWVKLEDKAEPPPYDPYDEVLDSMKIDMPNENEGQYAGGFRPVARNNSGMSGGSSVRPVRKQRVTNYSMLEMLRYYNKGPWVPDDDVGPMASSMNLTSAKLSSVKPLNQTFSKFRLTDAQQHYFREWHYVSPKVIDEERCTHMAKQSKAALKSIIGW